MWHALSLLVVVLLGVGVYAVVTGGASAHAATPPAAAPSSTDFGFALAAGAIALAATLMVSRPRLRRPRR